MTTQIIFVRHGQTEWNYLSRYQGHTDVVLSEEGINRPTPCAKGLQQAKLEAIYSSDLQRAIKPPKSSTRSISFPCKFCPNYGKSISASGKV